MEPNRSSRVMLSDQVGLVRSAFFALLAVLAGGTIVAFQVEFILKRSWGWLVLLGFLHVGFVILAERALMGVMRPIKNRLRLAFLLSAGLSLVVIIPWTRYGMRLDFLHTAFQDNGLAWLYLGIAFISAYAGGLIATGISMPLWEDNYPPASEIRAEVLQRHQQNFGDLASRGYGKRGFDLLLATAGLVLSCPIWLACIFLVWIEDPGPVFFLKNSVGKGGVNFRQLKLRTMVHNAEAVTGPVLSPEHDRRVLRSGRLFRKTALDELPQLINILAGEMSFVGPRPQRTVLVHDYVQNIPEYAARHMVQPGLAGLAQVAGDYYLTPRQKLRFDRLYIQHMSLGFDLKLIFLAFLVTFWFRWQKGWNGRLPRSLLHKGALRVN